MHSLINLQKKLATLSGTYVHVYKKTIQNCHLLPGKHMRVLVNEQNKLAAPMNNMSLANPCIVLLTKKQICRPSEQQVPFSKEHFKIATSAGKYMRILVNKENTLATPLNSTFLCPPEQFKIATPSGKYMRILSYPC